MTRTPRPCSTPGCPKLTNTARCPTCERKHRQTTRHGTSGSQWDTIRRQAHQRAHGRCERCNTPTTLTRTQATANTPLAIAAHLIPHANGGPDTLDNIENACERCHNAEHYPQETP